MNRHQVSVAAESFAAGAFAHAGYSVFVQYGANQPGFDLMVTNMSQSLMVSVKGSTNSGWILTAKEADKSYADALDAWTLRNSRMVFCLVQFDGVAVGRLPRMYLVPGAELGAFLRTHSFGDIALTLLEHYEPKSGPNKGKCVRIPQSWDISQARVDAMFTAHAQVTEPNR